MDVERVLRVLSEHHVRFLLIGGMHFLLRHQGSLTYDIDIWIEDTPENRLACEQALTAIKAEWGATDAEWGPVADKPQGWTARQGVYCTMTDAGAVDVFRSVKGLGEWKESFANAVKGRTTQGLEYDGLSDSDMLRCQLALAEGSRKLDRIKLLEERLRQGDASET